MPRGALVPPIDRQYTLMFFFNRKTLDAGDERTFKEVYPHFDHVSRTCRERIAARVGRGWHTSSTKIVDNAIVGFVRMEMAR